MANRPVKIRRGSIDDLVAVYKQTYKNIAAEIIGATEAGRIQKAKVMVSINRELESLGVDVNKWARAEIPQYYLDGANAAVQDLRKAGIDVTKSSGAAVVNKEAIAALTDDVALSFAEGIKGVSRSAQRLLSDALKQQLNFIVAEGKLSGDARQTVSDAIKQRLESEGLSALIDSGGKSWSFDAYAEMLARTKSVEARNQGLANRMLSSGYDLVQVSDSNSEHPACADWEGEILSITGNTDGYDTVQDATDAGLFHPNCEHAINVIVPSLAEKTEAYDNPTDNQGSSD